MKIGTINIVIALLVAGCQLVGPNSDTRPSDSDQLSIIATGDLGQVEKDPFQIVNAAIEGDVLRLTLSFGGGCEDHDFAFFSEGPVLESFPPGAMIRIFHDSHGDPCEALLQQSFELDLQLIRSNSSDEVVVFLLEFDHSGTRRLSYKYK